MLAERQLFAREARYPAATRGHMRRQQVTSSLESFGSGEPGAQSLRTSNASPESWSWRPNCACDHSVDRRDLARRYDRAHAAVQFSFGCTPSYRSNTPPGNEPLVPLRRWKLRDSECRADQREEKHWARQGRHLRANSRNVQRSDALQPLIWAV